MPKQTNRRTILAGLIGASASAAALVAAKQASANAPDPIIGLEARRIEAERVFKASGKSLSEAIEALEARGIPQYAGFAPDSSIRAETYARIKRERDAAGLPALYDAHHDDDRKLGEIEMEIYRTPATSAAGVAIKVRMAMAAIDADAGDWDMMLLQSAAADAERIAEKGGAA